MIPPKNIRKAIRIRPFVVMAAFLFFTPFADAQFSMNERCMEAYHSILMLHFGESHKLLNAEKTENPGNPVPEFLENYMDFLTLFIGEERNQYAKLKDNIPKRIGLLEKGNRSSPFFLFTIAEVNLQWAFIRLKFGDYTMAALEVRKAYQLFQENQRIFPDFLPNKLGLGVIHILAGMIPENYRWMARMVGVDGSMEKGLGEINQIAYYVGPDKTFRMFRPEAMFYLSVISANLVKDKATALGIIRLMEDSFSDEPRQVSPLLIYARASILMKNGYNENALGILTARIQDHNACPFYYLDYLEGMAKLNKLDFQAGVSFKRFLDGFKGINYVKATYQKLAWIGFLKGDTSLYFKNMALVKGLGNSIVDEDKQAIHEAEKAILPNAILLKARLLCDGGYYNLALKELLDNSLPSFLKTRKDFLEYSYRLGRIYHESGNNQKALLNYSQTIDRGKNEPYYFAAAASYQMGLIYENQGKYAKADSVYRLCISIRTPEYKTSLNQKAKAGLNRLGKYSY